MVTLLDEKGVPTPVVWTRLRPPVSRIGDIGRPEVDKAGKASARWSKYATVQNPESAEEKLAGAIAAARTDSGPNVRVEKPPSTTSRSRSTAAKKDGPGWFGRFWTSREGRSMISTFFRWLLSFFSRGR
jgi:hypothetical protein